MTILCTIHQPSSEVFHVFDKLLLLSKGKTVYFGNNDDAIPYFAKMGYPVPQFCNPADHFMTLVNTDFEDAKTGDENAKRSSKKVEQKRDKLVKDYE